MIPVKSPIHPDELHDKYVYFDIPTDQGQQEGVGRFVAQRNANGWDYIEIRWERNLGETIAVTTWPLGQEAVNGIRRTNEDPPFALKGHLVPKPGQ